jgi:hypothetical protein
MGLFSEPSAPVEPPSLRTLIVFLLIGMAMFLADVVLQRITGVVEQAPVGLIGGGAVALGGVVGWLWQRSRFRAAAR